MDDAPPQITTWLQRLSAGDRSAEGPLLQALYDELRAVAGRSMAREPAGHTLQPTALVHEVWARLVDGERPDGWQSRGHFLAYAARAMRNLLVDHARARQTLKRGARQELGDAALDRVLAVYDQRAIDVLELHDALGKLAERDEELTRLVELRFFSGLSIPETGAAMGLSHATVERRWSVARAWLASELAIDD